MEMEKILSIVKHWPNSEETGNQKNWGSGHISNGHWGAVGDDLKIIMSRSLEEGWNIIKEKGMNSRKTTAWAIKLTSIAWGEVAMSEQNRIQSVMSKRGIDSKSPHNNHWFKIWYKPKAEDHQRLWKRKAECRCKATKWGVMHVT